MNINVLIAPDFAPEHFAGWHMLNTLMQRKTGLALRLLTPASASEQAVATRKPRRSMALRVSTMTGACR